MWREGRDPAHRLDHAARAALVRPSLGRYPFGQLADRVVGFGGASGRHLEGVLLLREDLEAYLDAGVAGKLGEPATVIQKRLVTAPSR